MKSKTIIILGMLLVFVIGFFIGRSTITIKTETKYVKGETVKDTVYIPKPDKEEIPSNPIYLYKTDTIDKIVYHKVDTAKILEDWILNRKYNLTLFDNDKGKLNIDASVQYNQLKGLNYTFTPIQKETAKERVKVLTPYIGASCNTLGYTSVGGGVFYHNLGLELNYTTDFNKKGFDFGLRYKF